ncbi:UDP-glycosyltransferase 71A15 [Linum perenne]
MVELANHLVRRYPTLSVTICIMKMPFKSISFEFTTKKDDTGRIKFIDLDPPTMDPNIPPSKRFSSFLEGHGPQIKDIVAGLVARLAGIVLDMFCTSFMADAKELGVPSYVFYTCGATFLGLMFQIQALYDQGRFDPVQIKDSDTELEIPSLKSPLPAKLLPSAVVQSEWLPNLVGHTRRAREDAKGILVNTFQDFESYAIGSLNAGQTPPVYPVGPILDLKVKGDGTDGGGGSAGPIMEWLDQQPESSVVFLCFGSMGSFEEEQVKEIAVALERSGHRFLWSLRRPPPKSDGKAIFPTDYEDVTEGLPEGFLERTAGIGKVIGWAPQTMVLAHPSTGGFVSHCGWNSTLESVWYGVPVATWPMYAEQQLNAVLLVRELEMAEEVRMSFRKESGEVVTADEIEKGIVGLMSEENSERRKKMKEMSEKSRITMEDGGASYCSIARFIEDTVMKTAELIFVPSPGAGHLFAMVQLAKQLVNRDPRLSITVCVMKRPFESAIPGFAAKSFANTNKSGRIRFVDLPTVEPDPNATPGQLLISHIDAHKIHIREIVSDLTASTDSPVRLAGFVLDMFCTSFIDVANEFGVPSYVFYTCGATFLGFMFHLQNLYDQGEIDPIALRNSDTELAFPSLMSPLPGKNLPSDAVEAEWLEVLVNTTRRMREARGIMVNTYHELESHAVDSLSNGETPPVYPIGPILNLKGLDKKKEIIEWLDDQPQSSVVFLCFGSLGIFVDEQLKEIATALELSGMKFLWSIRKSPEQVAVELPSQNDAIADGVLPEGFLQRTAGIGKVIGWAPQTEILAHPSIGGFVSHCGWNSTLESIWFGVPIAAWPIYAEQQLNAFKLVKEMELAEDIRMDYRRDSGVIVKAEEIERGIRRLMAAEEVEGKRKKLKEMSDKGRRALIEGGSSYASMNRLIEVAINNCP